MVKKPNQPKELTIKVPDKETGEVDVYTIKTPTGPVGWKHFMLVSTIEREEQNTQYEEQPDNRKTIIEIREDPVTKELTEVEIDNPNYGGTMRVALPNPKLEDVIVSVMDKWVNEVLPSIITSHDFNDVKWTALLPIFQAALQDKSSDLTLFQGLQ